MFRIGELSRRVGVRPETLRAWERRYALTRPDRTGSGYRLYSAADEARVRAMTAFIAQGISAAEAARLARVAPEGVQRDGIGATEAGRAVPQGTAQAVPLAPRPDGRWCFGIGARPDPRPRAGRRRAAQRARRVRRAERQRDDRLGLRPARARRRRRLAAASGAGRDRRALERRPDQHRPGALRKRAASVAACSASPAGGEGEMARSRCSPARPASSTTSA